MANKRTYYSLVAIEEEAQEAEVHFGIEMLSPVKKSKSGYDYYNARVSDSSKALRLVGFDDSSQKQLARFVELNSPVKLTNCSIRKSRTDELEIHVNRATKFAASLRKLQFQPSSAIQAPAKTTVANIGNTEAGSYVNVTGKVTNVVPPRTVSTGIVQEATVADETGVTTMSLWNKNVDMLAENTLYQFTNLVVITF